MPDSDDTPTIPTGVKFETPLNELDTMPDLPPGHALIATIQIIIMKAYRAMTCRRKIVSHDQIKSLQKMLDHKEVLSIELSLIPEIPPPPAIPTIDRKDSADEDEQNK